ncbi:MAG: carbohydrate kinase family protein [Methanoregulaceae archaeon]
MIHIVGHTAIDHISRVPVLPPKNGSTRITDRKIYFGGGAANIAAGIAILGEKATLHSAVGDDFPGSDYEKWMDNLGITRCFFTVPDTHTPTAFMFTDDAGDQCTFFEWGASRIFCEAEAPALPFVHMATADPAFNVQVAKKSAFSSFDPGQDVFLYSKDQLNDLLDHIDILFANRHEVAVMCEKLGAPEKALSERVPVAIFTAGGEGSTLYEDGEKHHIPPVQVTMADPTGAGDGYRAGFLTAYARGYSTLECCQIGTVTASHIVEHIGCQTHLPTWAMMVERYRKYFGNLPEIPAEKRRLS